MDLVVTADQLPKPGETILGHSFQTFCGGKGANQAVAAARAGGKIAMIARVGADGFGKRLVGDLAASGVDTSEIRYVEEPSGVALIVTAANGENAIVVAPGANNRLDAAAIDEVMRKMTADVTHVLVQLETPMDGVIRAAEWARDLGATFILDPAPARPLAKELLELTDWITPNEREAGTLLGAEKALNPFEVVRALRAMGPRNIILKMSSKGAVVLAGNADPVHVRPVPVKAVDTTAAGDAFNGAFAVALSEGRSAVESAEFAAAAAALSVTRRGAQPSMPMRGEIDAISQHVR